MDANGNDERRLTENRANDYSPIVSPNGRQIAFVSERDGNPEIYVMQIDGTRVTRLTNHRADDLSPAWARAAQASSFGQTATEKRAFIPCPAAARMFACW